GGLCFFRHRNPTLLLYPPGLVKSSFPRVLRGLGPQGPTSICRRVEIQRSIPEYVKRAVRRGNTFHSLHLLRRYVRVAARLQKFFPSAFFHQDVAFNEHHAFVGAVPVRRENMPSRITGQ